MDNNNVRRIPSEDEIISHYNKMTKEKDCDALLVSATIFYVNDKKSGKPKKYVTCTFLPIIMTLPRYMSFVQSFGGEYRWNEEKFTHERIFWCRYKKEYKSLADMYNANEQNIARVMGQYINPVDIVPVDKDPRLDESPIILPN